MSSRCQVAAPLRELRTYNNSRGWLYSINDFTVADGKSIFNATYGHIANNNLKSISETMNGNWAPAGLAGPVINTWSYGYDYLNRLQTATSNNNGTFTYTYDRYGNRWNQSGGTLTYGATFHNSQNRVDGATYDASGNLTQDPPGNPVRHSYTYDAENRLSGVTDLGITYTYDAAGKRIGVYTGGTLSKSFLCDQDQSSFMVFDHAGNLSSLNLFAAGRNIFQDTGGYWGYPIADALDTIRSETDGL
ncbi:MAG: hypothetical protein ACR2JE_04640 [Acidobacteriaceae bacterium]